LPSRRLLFLVGGRSLAELSCIGSRRRRSAPPQAARSGTPYGRAAWAPVPSVVPMDIAVRRPQRRRHAQRFHTDRAYDRRLVHPVPSYGRLCRSDGSPVRAARVLLTTCLRRGPRTQGWRGSAHGWTWSRGWGGSLVIPSVDVPGQAEQTRPYQRRSFVRQGAPPSPVGLGPLPAGWDDDGGDDQAGRLRVALCQFTFCDSHVCESFFKIECWRENARASHGYEPGKHTEKY
jgi:hypothetical protein